MGASGDCISQELQQPTHTIFTFMPQNSELESHLPCGLRPGRSRLFLSPFTVRNDMVVVPCQVSSAAASTVLSGVVESFLKKITGSQTLF